MVALLRRELYGRSGSGFGFRFGAVCLMLVSAGGRFLKAVAIRVGNNFSFFVAFCVKP